MEVIFQHQLTNHRFISGAIGRTRRRWKRFQQWYPIEQNNQYSHMDVIYKEIRDKYGYELFRQLVQEKRLNSRIFSVDEKEAYGDNHDIVSNINNLKKTVTTNENYGRLPQYKYEVCERALRFRDKL